MIESEPEHVRNELIALAWFASRMQPNVIDASRYGLCQIDIEMARREGFSGDALSLLEPKVNIALASCILQRIGIVEYCGHALGHELLNIVALAKWLDAHPSREIIDETDERMVRVARGNVAMSRTNLTYSNDNVNHDSSC